MLGRGWHVCVCACACSLAPLLAFFRGQKSCFWPGPKESLKGGFDTTVSWPHGQESSERVEDPRKFLTSSLCRFFLIF